MTYFVELGEPLCGMFRCGGELKTVKLQTSLRLLVMLR